MFKMNAYNRLDAGECILRAAQLKDYKWRKGEIDHRGTRIIVVADGVWVPSGFSPKKYYVLDNAILKETNGDPREIEVEVFSVGAVEKLVMELTGHKCTFGMYMLQVLQSTAFTKKHKVMFLIPSDVYFNAEEKTRIRHRTY